MINEKGNDGKQISILESIDLVHSKIELRSDGIIQLTTATDFLFTLKETRAGIEAIGKLSENKLIKVLKIAGLGASVDTASRRYIASGAGSRYSLAEAIVIQSFAQKLIGNFYLKVEKPVKPTQIFTAVNKAVDWLHSF